MFKWLHRRKNNHSILSKACRLHTTTLRTGSTIDTCFDADKLD